MGKPISEPISRQSCVTRDECSLLNTDLASTAAAIARMVANKTLALNIRLAAADRQCPTRFMLTSHFGGARLQTPLSLLPVKRFTSHFMHIISERMTGL